MPEKFVVPQFIENEDKILGPITVRQFLICLGATFAVFIEYRIFQLPIFIMLAIITAAFAGVFGFLKINGQPFHLFFVNVLQTMSRPRLRVWHKELVDAELRVLIAKPPEAKDLKAAVAPKSRPESTRLRDLALTVNTGGVYNPDEDES
jgi:hypothetical protein